MPFRDAHSVTGSIVKYCIENKKTLPEMSLDEFKSFSKLITADISGRITTDVSVNGRTSFGGTSKKTVFARIKKLKSRK
jgi:argininosuccinate lyase